jgi:hypothetical protein
LTETVTFCVFVQPPAVRVYTYVTVFAVVAVLVSVSEIVAVVPFDAVSEIPVTAARDQLNAVPDIPLVAV